MKDDEFLTITKQVCSEIKVKGSRFIGTVVPAETKEDAEAFIFSMKKDYYDATHNCFAYRVGTGPQKVFRYSDDGEPSGTAGKPIMTVIEGEDLTNICLVVTRYFGGTKLGTGGLIRAYTASAKNTLAHARSVKKIIRETIGIRFAYDHTSPVMRLIDQFGGRVVSQDYGSEVVMNVSVRRSKTGVFKKQLFDAVRGKVQFV